MRLEQLLALLRRQLQKAIAHLIGLFKVARLRQRLCDNKLSVVVANLRVYPLHLLSFLLADQLAPLSVPSRLLRIDAQDGVLDCKRAERTKVFEAHHRLLVPVALQLTFIYERL